MTATEQKTPPKEMPLRTGFDAVDEGVTTAKAAVKYQVAVYTGDIPNAGTDGDVYLFVDGTRGNTGQWLLLDNSANNFERGQTDYFYFTIADLGTPVSAWIFFDPSGLGSDWFLDRVSINGTSFSYYNWITQRGAVRLKSP